MDMHEKLQVAKALVGLYYRQTSEEIMSHGTREENGVGFNKIDAATLTDIAEWILAGKPFTDKQFSLVEKMLKKYSGQIQELNLDTISIPESSVAVGKGSNLTGDGLLTAESNTLFFYPNVYPSSQIKEYKFRWDPQHKAWRGDLHEGNVNVVKRLFPGVVVDSSIVKQEIEDTPAAWEDSSMMQFQREAGQFLLNHRKAMLALAPGLGKTIVSIMAADSVGGVAMVICPLTLMQNWKNEIHKWLGKDIPVASWHGPASGWEKLRTHNGKGWVIVNYDTAVRNFVEFSKVQERGKKVDKAGILFEFKQITSLIVDESVMIKNRKAKRAKAIQAVAAQFKNVWLLSGSPTTRFYDDLWSQFHALNPTRFSSYWKFVDRYCMQRHNQWGVEIYANQPDADKTIQQDNADLYFARTQEQVLDLPDWIFENIHVPMDEKQYKLYLEMEDVFRASLPEGDVVIAANILSQLLRLVQLASNPILIGGPDIGAKWDAVIEMIEFKELPAIVWTTFIQTAVLMKSRIEKSGYSCATLTGDTKQEDRDPIVQRFQAGEIDVLLAHPGVGKFGLTLTRGRTAFYLERSYNGDDYYQSLHRIRRIGTEHSPNVVHLIADTPRGHATVDWVINRILDFRRTSALKLTSGLILEGLQNGNND